MENKTKNNICVIIPVHELNDETKILYSQAIKSIETQLVKPDEVLVVVPKNSTVSEYIKTQDYGSIKNIVKVVENAGETDFSTQFNLGVQTTECEWVSLLEYDDQYANIWFKNVVEYRNAYPDVELFMPIIVDVDSNDAFISLTNEAVWAHQFSDQLGFLDNNALQAYQNFNIDGMVMRKSTIQDFGGFKSNIKLTFIYEFLLRMTFKAVRIMTIPKYGYRHVNQRPGSLFATYKQTIDPVEARFWLAQAKKESYFQNDRKITYEVKS